jgi:hypothetical protein
MNEIDSQIVMASATGVVKTVLILIGVFVALRFLGRLMLAKNALEKEREALKKEKEFHSERNAKLKSFGKVSVMKSPPKGEVRDVDFEEVN